MRYEIENSGVGERKGLVQVRFCLYLEPGDNRYEEHCVEVPIYPAEGYPGEMLDGEPVDPAAYRAWVDSLPKEWKVNPFHNHFSYFSLDVKEADLHKEGKRVLKDAKDEWDKNKTPNVKNQNVKFLKTVDAAMKKQLQDKAEFIKMMSIAGRP